MDEVIARDRVVELTRAWIGTAYHHQASVRGAGCDCLGLIRGVWRDLYGTEPEQPPPYSPDWGEVGATEHLIDAANRHLAQIALSTAKPGDVILFRLRPNMMAKHSAILVEPLRMVHAQTNAAVCEVTYNQWWRRHAVAAFSFPGVAA
jgi:NlpC/P60 family putative phage cell wall peptidase